MAELTSTHCISLSSIGPAPKTVRDRRSHCSSCRGLRNSLGFSRHLKEVATVNQAISFLPSFFSMKHPSLFIILLCLPSLSTAAEHKPYWRRWMFWRRADRNVPPEGYHNPYKTGGSLLTVFLLILSFARSLSSPQQVEWTNVPGQGEPVNTIISGNSDQDVLKDQEVDGGLRNYFLYASCFYNHLMLNSFAGHYTFPGNVLGSMQAHRRS